MDIFNLSAISSELADMIEGTWDIGDGQTLFCLDFARKDEFTAALDARGFEAVRRFCVGGTEGVFYTCGDATVYYYENARTSLSRAVYGASLPVESAAGEPLYDDTLFHMFETKAEDEPYPGGMTYLIRLRDGRFIIIDGGFEVKPEGFLDTMKRLHPRADEGGAYDVAAWIFTHPHDDHIELLKRFFDAPELLARLNVRCIISNSAGPAVLGERCKEAAKDGAALREMTAELCGRGTVFFKPHTGMTFNIGELEFKMFYTQNEWTPSDMIYLNDSSAVFSVSRAGGRSIMMLGDIMEFAGAPIMKMYTADELRADAVQVAHHAVRGPEIEIYEAIRPKLCFWNMQPRCYELYSTKFVRNVKLRQLDAFHIISCFGPAQITL